MFAPWTSDADVCSSPRRTLSTADFRVQTAVSALSIIDTTTYGISFSQRDEVEKSGFSRNLFKRFLRTHPPLTERRSRLLKLDPDAQYREEYDRMITELGPRLGHQTFIGWRIVGESEVERWIMQHRPENQSFLDRGFNE